MEKIIMHRFNQRVGSLKKKRGVKTNSTGKKNRNSLGSALETYTSKNLGNLEEI